MFDAIGLGSFETFGIVADAPAERIAFIEEQRGFGIDESGAGNGGGDFPGSTVKPAKTASEGAAENAFLNPGLALFKFFVRRETGQFCTSAGAAWRTVEGFAGALNEVARMGSGNCWRAEKFDVIDLREALIIDGLANLPTEFGKLVSIGKREIVTVSFGEKKPISTPGDITADRSGTRNFDGERAFGPPAWDVCHRHLAVFVQGGSDNTNGRLDAVPAGMNAAHVGESGNEPNGSMAAHAEVTDVIEEDDTCDAGRIGRFEQGCANDNIGAAGFIYDCGTKGVMTFAKSFEPVLHAAMTEVRPTTDDDASRLAAGVGVYDGDSSHWENAECRMKNREPQPGCRFRSWTILRLASGCSEIAN